MPGKKAKSEKRTKKPLLFGRKKWEAEQKRLEEIRKQEMRAQIETEKQKKHDLKKTIGLACAVIVGLAMFGGGSNQQATASVRNVEQQSRSNSGETSNESSHFIASIRDSIPDEIGYSVEIKNNSSTLHCLPNQSVNPLDLVTVSNGFEEWNSASDADVKFNVSSDVDTIDLSRPGSTEVTYTVSNLKSDGTEHSESFVKVFSVVDKTNPEIRFENTKITMDQGTWFDPATNIASVSDAIDGDAVYLAAKPTTETDYSWYTIQNEVNTYLPGNYKVTVTATDISGNTAEKSYDVEVIEKVVQVPDRSYAETAPVQTGTQYVLNTNTRKFHYTWCSSASQIKTKNRWDYTGTREEVINMGYVPCKRCNP